MDAGVKDGGGADGGAAVPGMLEAASTGPLAPATPGLIWFGHMPLCGPGHVASHLVTTLMRMGDETIVPKFVTRNKQANLCQGPRVVSRSNF